MWRTDYDRGMSPAALVVLALLLCADAAFVGIHVLHATGHLADPLYALDRDRGYPELFQYIKFYWLVLLTLLLAVSRRGVLYLLWAFVFAFLLVDDSFTLHESWGSRLAYRLSLQPVLGLRANDVGELLFVGAVGAVVAAALGLGYLWADAAARRFTARLVVLVAVLAFFGVVVDVLAIFAPEGALSIVLKTTEEAGEMASVSVMLGAVFMSVVGTSPVRRPAPSAVFVGSGR